MDDMQIDRLVNALANITNAIGDLHTSLEGMDETLIHIRDGLTDLKANTSRLPDLNQDLQVIAGEIQGVQAGVRET